MAKAIHKIHYSIFYPHVLRFFQFKLSWNMLPSTHRPMKWRPQINIWIKSLKFKNFPKSSQLKCQHKLDPPQAVGYDLVIGLTSWVRIRVRFFLGSEIWFWLQQKGSGGSKFEFSKFGGFEGQTILVRTNNNMVGHQHQNFSKIAVITFRGRIFFSKFKLNFLKGLLKNVILSC